MNQVVVASFEFFLTDTADVFKIHGFSSLCKGTTRSRIVGGTIREPPTSNSLIKRDSITNCPIDEENRLSSLPSKCWYRAGRRWG
jgi:hypothetical protein